MKSIPVKMKLRIACIVAINFAIVFGIIYLIYSCFSDSLHSGMSAMGSGSQGLSSQTSPNASTARANKKASSSFNSGKSVSVSSSNAAMTPNALNKKNTGRLRISPTRRINVSNSGKVGEKTEATGTSNIHSTTMRSTSGSLKIAPKRSLVDE